MLGEPAVIAAEFPVTVRDLLVREGTHVKAGSVAAVLTSQNVAAPGETPPPLFNRLAPAAVIRCYLRILTHRVSFAYILVGAAGGATVFAYVTGSSPCFIGVVRLTADQYGLIFSACSAAVMSGALLDGHLGRRGVQPAQVVTIDLSLSAAAASTLLAMRLGGWTPPALVAALLAKRHRRTNTRRIAPHL